MRIPRQEIIEARKERGKCYRRRMEYESDLLNSRTNIVLVVNGLAAVAVNLKGAPQLLIAVAIIGLDALWIPCAWEARCYLKGLFLAWSQVGLSPDEEVRQQLLRRQRWRLSPTRLIGVLVPILLLLGWILGLLLASPQS